jgi:hypothetical protein
MFRAVFEPPRLTGIMIIGEPVHAVKPAMPAVLVNLTSAEWRGTAGPAANIEPTPNSKRLASHVPEATANGGPGSAADAIPEPTRAAVARKATQAAFILLTGPPRKNLCDGRCRAGSLLAPSCSTVAALLTSGNGSTVWSYSSRSGAPHDDLTQVGGVSTPLSDVDQGTKVITLAG